MKILIVEDGDVRRMLDWTDLGKRLETSQRETVSPCSRDVQDALEKKLSDLDRDDLSVIAVLDALDEAGYDVVRR